MFSNKVFTVIKREYLTRLKTKGFIIGTFLLPILMILMIAGVVAFGLLVAEEQRKIVMVDQTGEIFEQFTSYFPDTLDNGEKVYDFIDGSSYSGTIDDKIEIFKEQVLSKEIDGYIVIPEDLYDSLTIKYSARNVSNLEESSRFTGALNRLIQNKRLEELELSPNVIRRLMSTRVRIETRQVTKEGEIESSSEVNAGLAYLLTILLYITLLVYGAMVMRSVLEEKTQRITETIVSSIKPLQLLGGKIAGICSLGITQLLIWGIVIYIPVAFGEGLINRFAPQAAGVLEFIKLIHFSPLTFVFFIVFFILGFVLYSALFAVVGSIVNTEDEAQQLQLPVMIPIIFQYVLFFFVVQHPESDTSYWVSLIPFFTPILMLARLSVLEPQIPDGLFLSVILTVITVILVLKLTSKIYRVGILMYGKRPNLKELMKWIKYS
ncbi:ABC transporter permease [candidate division KSB1 bacterium]